MNLMLSRWSWVHQREIDSITSVVSAHNHGSTAGIRVAREFDSSFTNDGEV